MNLVRSAAFVLLGGLALAGSGCNYVGAAYVLVKGPEKTPAAYTLEKDRPTVIFVDDRANVLPRRSDRTQIAKAAQETLLKEGALTNVIDASAAMQAALRESSGQPLDITTLGKQVQADVVVYVTMESFVLSTDGQTFAPQAKASVKVIDTRLAKRVFPLDKKEGHPITVILKLASGTVPQTSTEQMNALSALADRTGFEVAKVFYDALARESIRQGN
jgi:hypothetical protein